VEANLAEDEIKALAQPTLPTDTFHDSDHRYTQCAQILLRHGRFDEAKGSMEEWTKVNDEPRPEMMLAEYLEKKDRWAEAAALYAKAFERTGKPVAAMLQGVALVKAGKKAEGERLVDLANLMFLGDDDGRAWAADLLEERGWNDAAAAQNALILRTCSVRSMCLLNVGCNGAYYSALAKKEYSRAARAVEVGRLQMMNGNGLAGFTSMTGYLHVSLRAHFPLMKGAIEKGEWDKAAAEAGACLRTYPLETNVLMEIVPALDKAGKKDLADKVFAPAWDACRKQAHLCPELWGDLNGFAWMAARCRRELDDALDFARKAVDGSKEDPGILDTLAEVYFQRGEKDKAIETIKKCQAGAAKLPDKVAGEKMAAYAAKQLKRFEAGDANTAPAEP
jgi:tetratricopeptide (TPR) repeat protein